jgi:hypothetical protein
VTTISCGKSELRYDGVEAARLIREVRPYEKAFAAQAVQPIEKARFAAENGSKVTLRRKVTLNGA